MFGDRNDGEEKLSKKEKAMMERFGMEGLSDPRDLESVKRIAQALTGNRFIEYTTNISGKPEDAAKISYLRAIMEQNWILIRQLERLNLNMEIADALREL